MSTREFKSSPWKQGVDEEIAYSLVTTLWGSNPTGVVVSLHKDNGDGTYTDVSSTCLEGSVVVVGDQITTPLVKNLEEGYRYRFEIKFSCGGNTFEPFGRIIAEL